MSPARTKPPFRVSLPDGWEDQTIYMFMGPQEDEVQPVLTLTNELLADDITVEELARERIDATLEALGTAEVVNEQQRALANGHAVYEAVLKWIPSEDQIIYRKQVYLIVDDQAFTFAANFSRKTLKTLGNDMNTIIETFTPTETQ